MKKVYMHSKGIILKGIMLLSLTVAVKFSDAQLKEAEIRVRPAFNYGQVITTADGGFACIGNTSKYGDTLYGDMYMAKLDMNGNLQWTKTFGGSKIDFGTSLVQCTDKGYLLAGYTQSFGLGGYDQYFVKIDSVGNIQWQRTMGSGAGHDYASYVIQCKDGGYVSTGYTTSFGAGSSDVYITKLDASGNLVWTRVVGGPYTDYGNYIANDYDGGFIVAGSLGMNNSNASNAFIIKLDSLGNVKWSKYIGGSAGGEVAAHCVLPVKGHGYVLSGVTDLNGDGMIDAYFVKLDSAGNIIWTRTVGGTSNDGAARMMITKDGGYLANGTTYSYGSSAYLVKLDSTGALQWTKTYGSNEYNGEDIMQTANGNYVAGALSDVASEPDFDILVMDSNFVSCSAIGSGGVSGSGGIEANAGTYTTGGSETTPSSSISSGGYVTMLCSVINYIAPKARFYCFDSTFCANSTMEFKDTSANYPTSWKWTFTGGTPSTSNSRYPQVSYPSTGTYTVKLVVSNSAGKDSITRTVHVTVYPIPVLTLTSKDSICEGSPDTLGVNGGSYYYWSTGASSSSIIVNPTVTTTYTVRAFNTYNCYVDTTLTVNSNPLPVVNITGDSAACAGSGIQLDASGALYYVWTPSTGLSCSNCPNPVATPLSTLTYTVIGTNKYGCSSTAVKPLAISSLNSFDLTGELSACIEYPTKHSAIVQACIFNNLCEPVNGTLKLLLDTAIHITSTTADTAATVSGDTLIWHYTGLSNGSGMHCVTLNGTIDSLPASDSAFVTMLIDPAKGDTNPSNNMVTYWLKTVSNGANCVGMPYSLNQKSAYPPEYAYTGQELTYTIHFQNIEKTIANTVVVIDTLNQYLDPTTLKIVSSSAPVVTTISAGHILKFTFYNINLPDTATSKSASSGIIQYTINVKKLIPAGSTIVNTAHIYFDSNPVVITNTTVNYLVNGEPISVQSIENNLKMACFPNPFSNITSIVFNTNGKHYLEVDDITGRRLESIQCSGIQYELSRNGLASGVYFIKAWDEGQKYVVTKKVVVQ